MTRDVKVLKKGESYVAETITIATHTPSAPQSLHAYKDLVLTLQACLDSHLLRAHYDAPDKVTIRHTENGWVIESLTVRENGEPTTPY